MAAPIQAQKITHFPNGVTSYGFPLVGKTTGRVFFVDSTNSSKGDDGNHGETPQTPFATIAYAVSQSLLGANRGDVIYVCPGHIETLATNGAITMSVAGVKLVGIGGGRDRPKLTLSSSVAASIIVSANNCQIENIVIDMTGIDQIGQGGAGAAGIEIRGEDFTLLSNELIIATGANQVKNAISMVTTAQRCKIVDNLIGGTATDGPDGAIYLYGAGALTVEGLLIAQNRIFGSFAIAGIYLSMTDKLLNAYIYDNKVTAAGSSQAGLAITVGANSTGIVEENKLLGTDVSSVYSTVAIGIANINNEGYDIDTSGLLGTTVPIVGTTLPASASLVDQILGQEFSAKQANYLAISVDFANPAWNTVATHEFLVLTGLNRVIIIPECTSDLTSGGAASMTLGDESDTASLVAATIATTIDAAELWLTATPAKKFAKSAVLDFIADGLDIGFQITVVPLTGGIIVFHVWTIPLSATASAGAGAGGAL